MNFTIWRALAAGITVLAIISIAFLIGRWTGRDRAHEAAVTAAAATVRVASEPRPRPSA
jgi:hypothetical protein